MSGFILFVFSGQATAAAAGFRGDGHHKTDLQLRAWWPSRDLDALKGVVLARVVVTEKVILDAAGDHEMVRDLSRGLEVARSMLREAPSTWLEL